MSVWDTVRSAFGVLAAAIGEDVTYTFETGSRTIRVIVDRRPRESGVGANRVISAPLTIEVENDAVTGIDPSAMNIGGDTITVAERVGGTAEAHEIVGILAQDEATVRLELR